MLRMLGVVLPTLSLGLATAAADQTPLTVQIDRTQKPATVCINRLPSGPCTKIGTISPTNEWVPQLGAGPIGFGLTASGTRAAPRYVEPDAIAANAFVGMVNDGSVDVTSRLQAALTYAADLHLPLRLCGTYKISAPLTVSGDETALKSSGAGIIGCSVDGARLLLADPTQDGIVFTAPSFAKLYGCRLENININAAKGVLKTAGAGVRLTNGNRCRIERVKFGGMYIGIYMDSTALSQITYNDFLATTPASAAPGSTAIAIRGNDVNSYIVYNYADNAGAARPSVGVSIADRVNGEYIEGNSFSKFDVGLDVEARAGATVQNLFFRQNAWDLCGDYGGRFVAHAATASRGTPQLGKISRIFMVSEWFAATQRGPGLRFAGDGLTGNVQMDGVQIRGNATNGLELAGNVSGGFTADNLVATANNVAKLSRPTAIGAGVAITDPRVSHAVFSGGLWDATAEEYELQSYGFTAVDGVDYISIANVDMSRNAIGPMKLGRLGTHNSFTGIMGYNPVGGGRVTVGASPWIYRAGPSPETIYVRDGTCSLVLHQSIGVNTACATLGTYQLGPNETLQITYTDKPTVTRVVH